MESEFDILVEEDNANLMEARIRVATLEERLRSYVEWGFFQFIGVVTTLLCIVTTIVTLVKWVVDM